MMYTSVMSNQPQYVTLKSDRRMMMGRVVATRGTMFKDTSILVHWYHLGCSHWEPAANVKDVQPATIALNSHAEPARHETQVHGEPRAIANVESLSGDRVRVTLATGRTMTVPNTRELLITGQ